MPADQSPSNGTLQWLLEEPLLLEVVLVFAGVVLLVFLGLWVRRVTRDVERRRGVVSFVQGIDRFVRQDWEGATPELEKVLTADPANLEARVALGECYRELDRAAEAERLHTEAIEVFQDDRPGTRLALARDLLALDRADRALPWLEEIKSVLSRDPLFLEVTAATLEALGRYRHAAERVRELLLLLQGPDQEGRRATLRRRIGVLLAREGDLLEERGALEEAMTAFRESVSWNPTLTAARAGIIRTLATLGHGTDAHHALECSLDELERLADDPKFLMLPGSGGGELHPVEGIRPALSDRDASAPVPALDWGGGALPEIGEERARLALRLMEKEALFHCTACAVPLAASTEECPHCSALGSIKPLCGTYTRELQGVEEILDEIEENQAHTQRLVEALYRGEERAGEKLHRVGFTSLPVLYRELSSREDKEPLLTLLREFGVGVLEPFLELHRGSQRDRNSLLGGILHAFGERSSLLGLLAAAFGTLSEAEPFFLALAGSEDDEERRAVLDYFVAAARPEAFAQLQDFARVEVINHLSRLPAERLIPLLINLEEGHILIDWVLVDPTLQIEEALLGALGRATDRTVLGTILRRRGFHPNVERSLHPFLCHSSAQATVLEILSSFGGEALPHRVPVLLDPDSPHEARRILADLVVAEGGKAVREILVRSLGGNPTPLDEAALDIIERIGPQALPELRGIYEEERGLLAKFPLVRKRSQRRRELVLRALARIPGGRVLLVELTGREQDQGLRRIGERLLRESEET